MSKATPSPKPGPVTAQQRRAFEELMATEKDLVLLSVIRKSDGKQAAVICTYEENPETEEVVLTPLAELLPPDGVSMYEKL